jgi:hypothetical protein
MSKQPVDAVLAAALLVTAAEQSSPSLDVEADGDFVEAHILGQL